MRLPPEQHRQPCGSMDKATSPHDEVERGPRLLRVEQHMTRGFVLLHDLQVGGHIEATPQGGCPTERHADDLGQVQRSRWRLAFDRVLEHRQRNPFNRFVEQVGEMVSDLEAVVVLGLGFRRRPGNVGLERVH